MKKYIALTLAALMLTLPSCGSSEPEVEETEAETVIETAASDTEAETEAETEKPGYERPADVEVIDYSVLELAEDAVYDRANGVFVLCFTHEKIRYDADAKCSIGLISAEEAISITGTPDLTYSDVKSTEDFYRGIAIKVDEEIPAGEYLVSVTFGEYIVESFEQNIQ